MYASLRTSRLAPAALAAAAFVAAIGAPAAGAKVLPDDIDANPRAGRVENGQVIMKLTGGAASRLSSAGGRVSGSGDVDVKGRTIDASTTDDSLIDPTTMRGTVILDGSLKVRGKSRTATLKNIAVEPGIDKRVTAKIGSKTVTLGTLKGGKAVFSRASQGNLKGAKLSLSGSGAKKLNAATGGGFGSGSFATVDIQVINGELPLASGSAKVTIDPGLLSTLTQNGFSITPEAPATYAGGVATLALTAGAFSPEDLTGRLSIEGKLSVGNGIASIPLYGWRTAVGKGQNDLFAKFSPGSSAAAPLASLNLQTAVISIEGRTFSATGAKLFLSKTATDILQQQFKITYAPGQPLATVDLTGQLSGELK